MKQSKVYGPTATQHDWNVDATVRRDTQNVDEA